MDFSLVIPAYNEENYLPRLLNSVDRARENYVNGPDAIEVIVADNNSTDRTAEVARDRGCRVVPVEKRCIASARNGGAAVASGEVLCFIDADSQVHPDTFNVIHRDFVPEKYVAGATGVTMERMSLGIFFAYCMMVPMVWVMKMDTGAVFCRREDFKMIGGYNEGRLFAEDVQFLMNLRALGKPRGQKFARLTQVKAIASTRKFDIHGDWHYFAMLLKAPFLASIFKGKLDAFAREYWYNERREPPR